jgi:hypothetical protein
MSVRIAPASGPLGSESEFTESRCAWNRSIRAPCISFVITPGAPMFDADAMLKGEVRPRSVGEVGLSCDRSQRYKCSFGSDQERNLVLPFVSVNVMPVSATWIRRTQRPPLYLTATPTTRKPNPKIKMATASGVVPTDVPLFHRRRTTPHSLTTTRNKGRCSCNTPLGHLVPG